MVRQAPEPKKNAEPKTIRAVIPMEIVCAVDIVDGNGKEEPARLFLRAKGSYQLFALMPDGAEKNLKRPSKWLADRMIPMLKKLDGVEEGPSGPAEPADMGMPIPTDKIGE